MIDLFVIKSTGGELMLVKYDSNVSILPVWKSLNAATAYIASLQSKEGFSVEEFTFAMYDSTKAWHTQAGIKLFLHLR